jgi:hypothetical protein
VTEVLGALKATRGELAATKAEIVRLRRYGKHNRAFVVVDILLTIGLAASGAISVHAVQSADQAAKFATQLHANNISACQANNARLGKQEKALDAILQQVPPQNAVERAIIAKDLEFIRAGWAPKNCGAAYPLPPGG